MISLLFPQALKALPLANGSEDWRVLKTEHFNVIYPRKKKEYAIYASKLFERIHKEFEGRYEKLWLEYKTNVVLNFSSDQYQGIANVLYVNYIILYLENPRIGSFVRYEEWLEDLFRHEYTHTLSLQIWNWKSDFWLWRIALAVPPNLAHPTALIEGIAVYEESQKGHGRLFDPLSLMAYRAAYLEDAYPSLGEILNKTHRWPVGNVPYIYGARLFDELAKKAGANAPREYWNRDTPYLSKRIAYFSTNYFELYKEVIKHDAETFSLEFQKIEAEGLTHFTRLTIDGFVKTFLTYSEEEDTLLYFANPSNDISGIYKHKLIASNQLEEKKELLQHQFLNSGIIWNTQVKISSSDMLLYHNTGYRSELLDLTQNYYQSQIFPDRYISYPAYDKHHARLYFIERDYFFRSLKSVQKNESGYTDERVHLQVLYDGLLQFITVSPDGRFLATMYRQGTHSYAGLLLCEIKKNTIGSCSIVAKHKEAILTQPAFSIDSKELFFSSDVGGFYNFYSYHIKSKKTYKRTRFLTGVFYPTPTSKALYGISYFGNGYDLVSIDYNDLAQEEVFYFQKGGRVELAIQNERESLFEVKNKIQEDSKLDEEEYRTEKTWKPYLGVGVGGGSLINLVLGLSDPMLWHNILVSVGILQYNIPTGAPLSFSYIYDRYSNGLSLSYRRVRLSTAPDVTLTNRNIYGNYSYPSRFLNLSFNYGLESFDLKAANEYFVNGLSMKLSLAKYHTFVESISPEKGWAFNLEGRYYLRSLSRIYSRSSQRSLNIEYGEMSSGFDFFIPSFFPKSFNHVNYIGIKNYQFIGPDSRLSFRNPVFFPNSPIRNLDPYTRIWDNFTLYTYEYRLPLLWLSRSYFERFPNFFLREINMAFFAEYVTLKNDGGNYDSYAYGVRLGIENILSYVANVPGITDINLSVSRGKNSDTLFQWNFFLLFGARSFKNRYYDDTIVLDKITPRQSLNFTQTNIKPDLFQ